MRVETRLEGSDHIYLLVLRSADDLRQMAKQSFDEDMLTPVDAPIDDLADLTPAERDNMRGRHFRR